MLSLAIFVLGRRECHVGGGLRVYSPCKCFVGKNWLVYLVSFFSFCPFFFFFFYQFVALNLLDINNSSWWIFFSCLLSVYDMLLLFLVILSCYCGGSYGKYYEVCYGSELIISVEETPILSFSREWFFLPTKGRTRIPVADRIQVATKNWTDPHYEISSDKFIILEVTERNEGYFSYEKSFTLFRVAVKDCSSKVTKEYGSDYYFKCPNSAYSLEFTPLENTHGSESQVLWNRTNPAAGGRGRMLNNKWMLNKLTYEYNGYYTFRDINHKFVSRNRMKVEEQNQYLNKVQGQDLHITFGMDPALFDMTFKADADHSEKVLVMKAGELLMFNVRLSGLFPDRIQKLDGPTLQIAIEDLQPSDSGRFDFRDWQGNLALVVFLEVKGERYPPYLRYIGVAVFILTLVFCCCYVRKRCCKKTTRKNHSVPDTEAAPDVYYHGDNIQPSTSAHPSPSPSHGPTYPLYPQEPGSTYQPPLVPGPEEPHMSSSQPEARTTGSEEPPPYDSLFSSGAEPQFDLKGTTFPSAPPLSSDTPYSDAYTSDKLNFL